MALGLRRMRDISKFLPRFIDSGILNQQYRQSIFSPSLLVSTLSHDWVDVSKSIVKRGYHIHRFSTISEASHEFRPNLDLLTFLESTLDEPEGPYHYWLNRLEDSKEPFYREGAFLVLAGAFPEDSVMLGSDHIVMFERVKLLQRRHPQLRIFGFQSGSSVCSVASQTSILQTIVEEFITYPIMLSNQTFPEMSSGACYFVFKDFKSPLRFLEGMADLGTISRAIEEFSLGQNENSLMSENVKGWAASKKSDVIKEPYVSFLRNLLLYFPGCISVDEDGNRLFLSDSNHHRIIIFDEDGNILDCIGSSPGFEDGEFDSAKLLRPASSFYHAAEDCLYFVDSENYAIRKAHIGRRTLETLYPACDTDNKIKSIWSWVIDKLRMGREVGSKSEKLDSEFLICPWHLMEREDKLLVINRSFQTLWIMDAASGKIREVVTGYQNVVEICGEMIMEKKSLLSQLTDNYMHSSGPSCSLERLPYASLMSSVATFGNNIIFCDTVRQTILKLHMDTGVTSNLQLSNFGILGLPYWLSGPLESIFVSGGIAQRPHVDHLQSFGVLPGRCDIQVNVHIPEDTKLAGPLEEGCIWRQARGSAAEVSGSEDVAASAGKVGVAQQWFEELDSLAFSTPGADLSDQENKIQDGNFHEANSVHIDCAVNISPGTSEVIIYAVLYLTLNRNWNFEGKSHEEKVKRILDILNNGRNTKYGKDAMQLMLDSSRDIGELIFMKPLHLRIKFECQDHPKADTAKEIILTDSTIEVNVSLK